MQSQPFSHREVADLTTFGLNENHFKFGILSFESDKYICIKEPNKDGNLILIEPDANFRCRKKPHSSDAALVNPKKDIIALKTKVRDDEYLIMISNLNLTKRLKPVASNKPIVFWKWLSSRTLGYVTTTTAYVVKIKSENENPLGKKIKLFERTGDLAGHCMITGFTVDPTKRWALLSGLSSPDGGKTINGHLQLYHIEAKLNQNLDGHCGCFGEVFVHREDYKSLIFAFFERKLNESTQRIIITEIGEPKEGEPKFQKCCELQMPLQYLNDFPVLMRVSSRHGLLYLVTKFGHYFAIEISSASVISTGRLSNDPIFIGVRNSKTDGVYVITRTGKVISLDVDENNLVNYRSTQCNKDQVVSKLAQHYKLPDEDNSFISGIEEDLFDFSPATEGEPDWIKLISSMITMNPTSALEVAKDAIEKGVNICEIADIFLSNDKLQDFTNFLAENKKENRIQDAQWQTELLELTLITFPQVAISILQQGIWKVYDRHRIAQTCEQEGLIQGALLHYTDFQDIKRLIINNMKDFSQEWLVKYLSRLDAQVCLKLMKELLMQSNQNNDLVVQVSIAEYQKLGAYNIVQLLESLGYFDSIYVFLGKILDSSRDPELWFKYIEVAAKYNRYADIERVIKESKFYDPVKVKNFLKDIKLTDPRAFIFLCDMHNFIDDLTRYLYRYSYLKHLEVYVWRLGPHHAPIVLGTLLDLACDEKYMTELLLGVKSNSPIEQVILEFEKRNKLNMLKIWLETLVNQGLQDAVINNALKKIIGSDSKDIRMDNQPNNSQHNRAQLNEESKENKLCVICFVKSAEIAFIPCGHKRTCTDCSELVLKGNKMCPICREKIQSYLKIFD